VPFCTRLFYFSFAFVATKSPPKSRTAAQVRDNCGIQADDGQTGAIVPVIWVRSTELEHLLRDEGVAGSILPFRPTSQVFSSSREICAQEIPQETGYFAERPEACSPEAEVTDPVTAA
jgi:hypothetical protein